MNNILKDKLLLATFLSNLFYSMASPTVRYELVSNVGSKLISLNSICFCISGILCSILWNKYSNKLYKKYGFFYNMETILYIIICLLFISRYISPVVYYILDTIFYCLVTKNLICGSNRLKMLRYINKEREVYDNNVQLMSNASSLIEFTISLIFNFSIITGFILITIGICLDNFFYYNAWKETIK